MAFVFCIQRSLKDQPSVQHWPHSTIWDEELYCNILLVHKIHTTVSHKSLGVQSSIQVTVGLHLFIISIEMYVKLDVIHLQVCQYIFPHSELNIV